MQPLIDFIATHWTGILIAVSIILLVMAHYVNEGAGKLLADVRRELAGGTGGVIELQRDLIQAMEDNHQREQAGAAAVIQKAQAQVTEAARIIELGMQIMTSAQVNQWAGAREWLSLNAGHFGPYADDKGLGDPGQGYMAESLIMSDELERRGLELTSQQIADTLRVGIIDFEETGDADAGFPETLCGADETRPFPATNGPRAAGK